MKRAVLPDLLARQWQSGGWLSLLLRPFAAVAAAVVRMKRDAYRSGRRQAWRAAVPVVVVGNLYVGGTGKTPVVIETVRRLRERGWHPGVVSRGYGVSPGSTPRVGQGEPDPRDFGDEPALIAASTGAPVAIHPRRPWAAQALLARHPEVDVIVSDDGLQHLALARDLEIVVQDERGTGNGRMLPAGPLREPPSRLAEVDAVITHCTVPGGQAPVTLPASVMRAEMRLAPARYRRLADDLLLAPGEFASHAQGKRLFAAAGIGRPERYFATLRQAGLTLAGTLALPDHYGFHTSPFDAVQAEIILVTAKDAVKCRRLGDDRLWAVEVEPRFSPAGLFDWMDDRLRRARR